MLGRAYANGARHSATQAVLLDEDMAGIMVILKRGRLD